MLNVIQKLSANGLSRLHAARAEEGQTLVEYALIIGIVAVGLVASLTALKTQIEGLFTIVSTGLAGA
jgi:pilus assembly protein Flp/PilA